MTGLMHEREFSRKSFVKGGGALIVTISAASAVGKASAANGLKAFTARTPNDFLPDLQQVDSWLALDSNNVMHVMHGETELGHGTPTGILMVVADELDMKFEQMKFEHVESWLNATGGGSGSGGISSRTTQIRAAAAYAKQVILGLAAAQLGVAQSALTTPGDGTVSGGGKTLKYSDLVGDKMFNYRMTAPDPASTSTTATLYIPGAGISKNPSQYRVVGKSFPRIDIPAKVMGTYTYVQNVRIPGMLHARSVRPRGAGANTSQNHFPLAVDQTSISHIPGAQVVQVNNFLAVVAPKEYDAIQAAAQLKVTWKSDPKFNAGGSGDYWSWLRQVGDTNTTNPARWTTYLNGDNVPAAIAGSAKTVSATYKYHYNGFMPIGPHAAVADVRKDGATVYVQAQQINGTPASIQSVLAGLPAPYTLNLQTNTIRVIWYEGASSFGGGQTNEVNEQAAIASAVVGKPVRMQWMRWDQHGWDHWGMANLWDVKMGADASGHMTGSDWVTYGQAQSNIDTTRELLGITSWPATPGSGGIAPQDTIYKPFQTVASNDPTAGQGPKRVLAKTQPLYGGAVRCNFLRAPSAPQQFFASEQIVDELAHAVNMDPVAFRRQNIDGTTVTGARWLAVLDAATIAAGWKPKVAASNLKSGDVVTGRGFGFGVFASSQVGIVADVTVNKKTGRFYANHLTVAQNNGITAGPQLVANQMSGAMIQGLSRAMLESLNWNTERVTSLDWVSYPILRIKDAPSVTLINVHPGEYVTVIPGDFTTDTNKGTDVTQGNINAFNQGWLLTGSGEPPTAAIAAAMANAFFDATGVRIRQSPMNAQRVRDTLKNNAP